MTGRDRVWAALCKEKADRPPKGEILVEQSWVRDCGFQQLGEAVQYLGADLAVLPLRPAASHVCLWQEWAKTDSFLWGCLQGPVTLLSEQKGWHALSRLLVKQPEEAKRLIATILGEWVEAGLTALDRGCDGIVFFDDLAGDKGLLINPKLLQEIYFPLVGKALEQLDYRKIPVIFHSDGNIESLLGLLKNIGFWGIQGLQPSVGLGPAVIAPELRDWVFWGNFEFEGSGRLKTISEVELEVTQLLDAWREFPGYIFGSSGGLYKGLSLPEVEAAYNVVESWRR